MLFLYLLYLSMEFVKIYRENLQHLCFLITNFEYAPWRILKTPNIVKFLNDYKFMLNFTFYKSWICPLKNFKNTNIVKFLNDYKLNSTNKMILIEFKFPVSGISLVGKFNFGPWELRTTAEFFRKADFIVKFWMLILGSAYIEHNAFCEEKGCVITETSEKQDFLKRIFNF